MRAAMILILMAMASQPLMAADTPAPEAATAPSTDAPSIDAARAALDAKDFPTAQRLLAQLAVDQPKDADVWNLLGFTNRNMNLAGPALEAYEMALSLDPKHLGALEYQGELFVTLKRLDDAKKNLDRLKTLCKDCQEFQDLQAAIKAAPAE